MVADHAVGLWIEGVNRDVVEQTSVDPGSFDLKMNILGGDKSGEKRGTVDQMGGFTA